MAYTLRPRERLRNSEQIKKVLWKGRRISGTLFYLYFMPCACGHSRFLVIASKRVGNSVTRNRIRRLFKEALRLNKHGLADGIDLIIRLRPPDKGNENIYKDISYYGIESILLSMCGKAGILRAGRSEK